MTLEAHRMPGRGTQNTHQPAPMSGFTKNHTSSNIIAHEIVDVRQPGKGSTLQNNGNEIFNSGGYTNSQKASRRSILEAKFEQNFQKPMADRNRSSNPMNSADQFKNYT